MSSLRLHSDIVVSQWEKLDRLLNKDILISLDGLNLDVVDVVCVSRLVSFAN